VYCVIPDLIGDPVFFEYEELDSRVEPENDKGIYNMNFKLTSEFSPAGDQPKAIASLVDGFSRYPRQTLLGVTGSGKTYTAASVIEKLQLPTLVLAHNKTLAAQLYTEFKNFFPENKVCYFVSYYDYYQPESYLPQTDTYIEKDTQINEKIEQLRIEAAAALMSRKDVIVVASVSCIYGFGDPQNFQQAMVTLRVGQVLSRRQFMEMLIELLYMRNDIALMPATFRVRGDVIDVVPGFGGDIYRFEFSDDTIESIRTVHPVTCDPIENFNEAVLFPARPFIAPEEKKKRAIELIKEELKTHLPTLGLLEAHRLEQRTNYDIEMMEQLGSCKGIENYSRHFDGRKVGEPPFCLLDFFKQNPFSKEFLLCIDESHATIPQVRGMYFGDQSRKKNLIDFGFRLPSAFDNRPLKFHEFEKYLSHAIFISATPGEYEATESGQVVEQIVRPTGLVDPDVVVRPIAGHIEDVKKEILRSIKQGDRTLITTLTKRSAEELAEYFVEHDIKARYLHSEIDTLERTKVIQEFRRGVFDVLVGINLLREGLDIPEVGLVAIFDADKEGFLRNTTSLIQTIGRAARNVHANVILYADVMTDSMKRAIEETDRRRTIQTAYNKKHKITPQGIKKALAPSEKDAWKKSEDGKTTRQLRIQLEEEMRICVESLDFEQAITLRDKIKELKKTSRLASKPRKQKHFP